MMKKLLFALVVGLLVFGIARRFLVTDGNVRVGDDAKEITGTDADGVAFKLSDYRGKVVVLDFWGFW